MISKKEITQENVPETGKPSGRKPAWAFLLTKAVKQVRNLYLSLRLRFWRNPVCQGLNWDPSVDYKVSLEEHDPCLKTTDNQEKGIDFWANFHTYTYVETHMCILYTHKLPWGYVEDVSLLMGCHGLYGLCDSKLFFDSTNFYSKSQI